MHEIEKYCAFFVIYILTSSVSCLSGKTVLQDFKERIFIKAEHYYLHVSQVGLSIVVDELECTFSCLKSPLCLSINTAAAQGADGKLWCELLSSDKYRNAEYFKINKTSHHYSVVSQCSSSPCQNKGTCWMDYQNYSFHCVCEEGFIGKYCETAAKSCKDFSSTFKPNTSQLTTLHIGAKPTPVLCHMGDFGCGDGGWTLVMKIDGNKTTFRYSSGYWTDTNDYNLSGGETGFDLQETKLPTYWNTSFSKICLGMKIAEQLRFIVISIQADSLFSLIADDQYRSTSLGRDQWKMLIGSQASLQANCKKEGFNVLSALNYRSKTRIGILGNNENDCDSSDSRIGFGTGGTPDDSKSCGNEASSNADNGEQHIAAMGYILLQ